MIHDVVQRASLSRTVDALNDLAFGQRELPAAERATAAQWIAGRQGLKGAYADMFAGFPSELEQGIVVFTGERITSASARHILGEETSRALRLLRSNEPDVRAALGRANEGMMKRLAQAALDPRNPNPGRYCCGKCTVGFWRNLLSGGLDRQEERLRRGVAEALRGMRAGQGKWRVFPFWYTVLALSEMDFAEARAELDYAAPLLEGTAKRQPPSSVHGQRRHALACRVLEQRLA
jgi:hypothetical protein